MDLMSQALTGLAKSSSSTNRTRQLHDADARQNFDPSFDLRNPYYQDLYAKIGNPFTAETEGQKDQRKIVSAITQQQAGDYDLEYNQPRRSEMEGGIKRDEMVRDERAKADVYFDPRVSQQREAVQANELDMIKKRYVDPRIAEAEGRARAAEIERDAAIQAALYGKEGKLGAAQIAGDSRLSQEAIRAFGRVGETRGIVDPESLSGTQGELQARMPGTNYGAQAEDVAQAAEMIIQRYPGRNTQQLRALIPQVFEPGSMGEAELWLLEQEIQRRVGGQ